jgi:signal transduction histidine kinase
MDEVGLVQFIVLGTLLFFILVCIFIIFLFLHRRKMVEKEIDYQKLQVKQKEELLFNEIKSIEKERSRIAKDLHDEVGAMLSLIKMNVSQVPKILSSEEKVTKNIDTTTELVDQTIADVRRISRDLLPSILEKFGYVEAVKEMCNSWSSENIRFSHHINTDIRLPEQKELQLYRVTQEFVNNTIKHAECNEISISIEANNVSLFVKFHDNGKGFDYKSSYAKNSLGLKTIESRLSLVKANYTFDSELGKGTKLNIEIPLN